MFSNIEISHQPLPPKYLRTRFSKVKQSKIKQSQQIDIHQEKNYLNNNRIINEVDEQLQATFNIIKKQRLNTEFYINSKDSQNCNQKGNENIFSNLRYNTVKQYIRYVYMNYNIKDPLLDMNCQTPTNKVSRQIKRQSNTRKKIMSLKVNFQNELNSANTIKKQEGQTSGKQWMNEKNETQVSQFGMQNSYINDWRLNHSQHQKMEDKSHKFRNQFNNKQIKQQFRYCFMCQQAVLTANIQYHENRCEKLKSAYNMKIKQLIIIIQQKISRIKMQIHQQFIIKNKIQLSEMLQKIRIKMQKQISEKDRLEFSKYQLQGYDQIQQEIQKSSILRVFQLISMLKWFQYLNLNLQKHQKNYQFKSGRLNL